MATATRFQFGTDFRQGGRRAAGEADLAEARAEGFRAGEAQGRRETEGQAAALLAQLGRSLDRLLAQDGARAAEVEAQAVQVALAAARGLAGAALADKPLAGLEQAVRECLSHARAAPHLVVRVNEAALENAQTLVARLTRETGFAGKLVLLGEPEIAPGDARIEWADGGFIVDSQRLALLVDQAVAGAFGTAGGFAQHHAP